MLSSPLRPLIPSCSKKAGTLNNLNKLPSSNLQMADHKFAETYNLLCFCKVCYISFVINASRKISSSLLFIGAPWDNGVSYILIRG